MTCSPGQLDICLDSGSDWSMTVALEGVNIGAGPVELAIDTARGERVLDLSTGTGEIVISSAAPDGTFIVTVPRATALTMPVGRHVYALRVTDAAGMRQVYLAGRLSVRQLPEVG